MNRERCSLMDQSDIRADSTFEKARSTLTRVSVGSPGTFIAAWLLFLAMSSPAQAAPADRFLTIINPVTQEVLLRLPLREDETFAIRYIHSLDLTPVFEIFELDEAGNLALRATRFQMFGAGMGHWEGRGTIDFDGEWTWIRDIHETLGAFSLRVGAPSVDHTILYRDREIHLSDRWAGKRIIVTVTETGGPETEAQGQQAGGP